MVNNNLEEPLPAGGSCLLGSINLSEFVLHPFTKNAEFDFYKFAQSVKIATTYLNDVLDEGLPLHPLEEQRTTVADWRQIGLGIMGLHDCLIKLGIRYGSDESLKMSKDIGNVMINASLQQSARLASEFGTYPKYKEDAIMNSPFFKFNANPYTVELVKKHGLRNSQVLTCAPTGSLSTMIGVSGGIEPIYQISYTRKTETLNDGEDTYYKVFTPIARQYMEINNIHKEEDLPDIFVTAMSLDWKERIKMQSVWQECIDASISSTINLHKNTTVDEVKEIYIDAWKHGLKGVTVFRDGCKRAGVLGNHNKSKKDISTMSIEDLQELIYTKAQEEISSDPNKCPMCKGKMIKTGGCSECLDCGYSPCSI